MTSWNNTEDGVSTGEISDTGDYLVEREGLYYYWLDSTSPTDNHGPFESEKDAIDGYNGDNDSYDEADVDWVRVTN